MDALAAGHDAAVQMIDTSLVRVQCRRFATRYDKLAANYLALVKLASIRIWLRANEFTSWLVGRYVRPAGRHQLISLTGKSVILCPSPFAKIFVFVSDPNHFYNVGHPVLHEGPSRSSRTLAWDAVDADSTADERC